MFYRRLKRLIVYLRDGNDKMPDPDLRFELPAGMELEIRAGAGNDRIIGTEGNDDLQGGDGADRVYGSGGKKDKLVRWRWQRPPDGIRDPEGGPGKDFIEAFYGFGQFKAGRSRIFAGSGNDKALSGNGVRDSSTAGRARTGPRAGRTGAGWTRSGATASDADRGS